MKNKEKILNTFSDIVLEYLSEDDQIVFNDLVEQKLKNDSFLNNEEKLSIEKYTVEDDRLLAYRRFQVEALITDVETKIEKPLFFDMLLNLSQVLIGLGELNFAENVLNRVIANVYKDDFLKEIEGYAFIALGFVNYRQANWEEAFKSLEEAKSILEKLKDFSGLAKCENTIGTVYGNMGDLQKAKLHFEKAQEYLELRRNSSLSFFIQQNLAVLNIALTNYDEAIPDLLRVLEYFEDTQNYRGISSTRYNLGFVYMKQKKYTASIREIELCLDNAKKAEFLPDFTTSYLCKASVYLEKDDYLLSMAFADKSEELSYKINDRLTVADVYKVKGQVYSKLGDHNLAENHLLTSLRMNNELKNLCNYAETSFELGVLYKELKRNEDSQKYFNDALVYNKKIGATKMIEKIEDQLVY